MGPVTRTTGRRADAGVASPCPEMVKTSGLAGESLRAGVEANDDGVGEPDPVLDRPSVNSRACTVRSNSSRDKIAVDGTRVASQPRPASTTAAANEDNSRFRPEAVPTMTFGFEQAVSRRFSGAVVSAKGKTSMPGESSDTPKIIIDSDWKSQAQAEKEQLSKKSQPPKPVLGSVPAGGLSANPADGSGAEPADGSAEAGAEQPKFDDIVSLLMTQALTYMGAFPDPRTGRSMVSLELAKVFVDLLGILEQKTKGNLTDQENQVLARILGELRMEYVEVAKYVQQAVAEGKIKTVPMAGLGGAGGPGGPAALGGGFGGPGLRS